MDRWPRLALVLKRNLIHVEPGIVVMMYGLKIKSFVDFTTRWFPDGAATYDEQIAELATRIEQIAR